MGILLIKRKYEPIDTMLSYAFYIDGEKRGSLRNGETKELLLPPGHYKLKISTGCWGSQPMSLEINRNEKKMVMISARVKSVYVVSFVIAEVLIHYFLKIIWHIDISFILGFVSLFPIAYLFYFFVIKRKHYLNIKQMYSLFMVE